MDATAADPLVGSLLDGRYRVDRRIARGGMATVYEATDTRLNRVVALKVLSLSHADDPNFADRFVREARAAARLAHPHVVSVFDQGADNGTLFLAMEYVAGMTLRDLLNRHGSLPPDQALDVLEPILSALSAAHDAGFVHRDVKPENVLLTDTGEVKVADFGLARAVTASASTASSGGALIGTVSYLAPELIVDGSADARCDVYAVGVLLYEMLTGHKPHRGETPIQVAYKHVHEDVAPPSEHAADIPPYLDALVARATARRREARPADAKVFSQQLRRVRHAIAQEVYDDPELTADLAPPAPPGRAGGDVYERPELVTELAIAAAHDEPANAEPTAVVADAPAQWDTAHREHRRKRRRGWVALLVVLLLAVAAAVTGWYYGVARFTTAPDLVGMRLARAEHLLSSSDLSLHATKAFSESVPAGAIIATDPAPGARVLRDGTIEAVVSKGKERYEMPDLAGMSESQAGRTLDDRNLDVGDITRKYSEHVEKGDVIAASEPVGARLRRDTEVDLVVSKGRRPIDVPDVVAHPLAEARAELRERGLRAEITAREFHDAVPKGAVVSQDPADGTLYKKDKVVLVVSKGPPLVEVPSVFGASREDAVARLRAEGFDVDVRRAGAYIGFDLVSAQDPRGEARAPRGSTVTIYLY